MIIHFDPHGDNIDPGMFIIIELLNRKGYHTTYCCEGHVAMTSKGSSIIPYISFMRKYDFPIAPPFLNEKGKPTAEISRDGAVYWYVDDRLDNMGKEKQRKMILDKIYDWAIQLPKSGEYVQEYEWSEPLNTTYVWYVAYDANMNYDCLMTYINGGHIFDWMPENPGCVDKTPPLKRIQYIIPYPYSFVHGDSVFKSGVPFLNLSGAGNSYGVAYYIKKTQFEEIVWQMNGGKSPADSPNWYDTIVNLGVFDNVPIKTMTNHRKLKRACISGDYYNLMLKGLEDEYPGCKQVMYAYILGEKMI